MKTLAICSRKGGTAKTTTAQNIAAGLTRQGKKVLLIDFDSQTNLSLLLDISTDPPTIADVLEWEVYAAEAIRPTECGDLIPGREDLPGIAIRADALKEVLKPLQSKYDYCIIDTGAQIDRALISALMAADSAIICTQANLQNMQGVALLWKSIREVMKKNPALKLGGILITRFNPRSRTAQTLAAQLEELAQRIGSKVYKNRIRECTAVNDAQARQMDIFSFRIGSNAAKDYAGLIMEIQREDKDRA